MSAFRDDLLALLWRFTRERCGTALIETTLVVPLMLVLSSGLFEFGNMLYLKLLMDAGLRDGARFGARCNSQMYTDAGLPAINCVNLAKNVAVYGNVAGTGTVRVTGWSTASTDITIAIGDSARCRDAVVSGTTMYHSSTAQVCIVRAWGSLNYTGIGLLSLIGMSASRIESSQEERLIRF
jgi:Flp pilus assembly protein TadG